MWKWGFSARLDDIRRAPRRAGALNEGHEPGLGLADALQSERLLGAAPIALVNLMHEQTKNLQAELGVVCNQISKPMRKRDYPLAHWNIWDHIVHEVR